MNLLPTLQHLYYRQGDPTHFDHYLAQLRQRCQRKRRFIELPDQRFPAATMQPSR
ncbi:hypothetical protein [Xanthomonas sp. GPE 39]|uniref:hypothetical protein n=1 Tax=Xanthomonas sp. GPE 39 TaxID=1583099 RepID=UPI00137927D2|nr:hypothetical protein [Xanthomonas sp. GPE 39]